MASAGDSRPNQRSPWQINWGRHLLLRLVAVLRHPFTREVRVPFLQRWFERRYLEGGDPEQVKAGLDDLPNWPILIDMSDPDLEIRSLIRRIVDLEPGLDYKKPRNMVDMYPIRRLLVAVVEQAIQEEFDSLVVGPPGYASHRGSRIFYGTDAHTKEAMTIPRNLYEPLLREIDFSQTFRPGAYFESDKYPGIQGVSSERLESGEVVLRIQRKPPVD